MRPQRARIGKVGAHHRLIVVRHRIAVDETAPRTCILSRGFASSVPILLCPRSISPRRQREVPRIAANMLSAAVVGPTVEIAPMALTASPGRGAAGSMLSDCLSTAEGYELSAGRGFEYRSRWNGLCRSTSVRHVSASHLPQRGEVAGAVYRTRLMRFSIRSCWPETGLGSMPRSIARSAMPARSSPPIAPPNSPSQPA